MNRIVLALLAVLLFAGCVTQPEDWPARVGRYSQDQAVTELGPPLNSRKLSNGMVVDEWLTEHRHVIVAPEPYFAPPGAYFGPATPTYSETHVPDYVLQLTFGPDGKLKSWKTFAR